MRGVTFNIDAGETFALLGPNGAGKSTVIEILEGYRARSAGDVSVLGVDPQQGSLAWKARLGIVLQSGAESGSATVAEQLRHFARFYPHARDVDEVIDAAGLRDKAKTRISKLSGGQRRRVDVALGIIGRPELLFLDEPTTGFGPEARRQLWGVIQDLKAQGTTILLTTHDLDEATHLGDRAGIIADGELIDTGSIDEIGGQQARVPLVRWRDADGTWHVERATEPARFVAHLVAARHGTEPDDLDVLRPTLEDVYLDLVRRHSATTRPDAATAPTDGFLDDRDIRA